MRSIPSGSQIAITYPFDSLFDMRPMLWQAEDGFDFNIVGGYAYHPASSLRRATSFPGRLEPPGLQAFLVGHDTGAFPYGPVPPLSSQLVTSTREALALNKVRLVIVDRSIGGGAAVTELFGDALGPPTFGDGPRRRAHGDRVGCPMYGIGRPGMARLVRR